MIEGSRVAAEIDDHIRPFYACPEIVFQDHSRLAQPQIGAHIGSRKLMSLLFHRSHEHHPVITVDEGNDPPPHPSRSSRHYDVYHGIHRYVIRP
jgi:hypothetical protein